MNIPTPFPHLFCFSLRFQEAVKLVLLQGHAPKPMPHSESSAYVQLHPNLLRPNAIVTKLGGTCAHAHTSPSWCLVLHGVVTTSCP